MNAQEKAEQITGKCKGGLPAKKIHAKNDKHWKATACADCIAAALTEASKPSEALRAVIATYESMVESIHGEFCSGEPYRECESGCAGYWEKLAAFKKEFNL